jgi:hypothetical protein
MEKILIYTNEVALEQYKQNREKLNDYIAEFASLLKANNLNFNKEAFCRFIKEGTGHIWMLLRGQVEKDFENAKITSEIAKKNLLVGIKEKSLEFEDIHKRISAGLTSCQIQAKNVPISKGKALLTKEELELKRETLSIFIETEDQLELHRLQESLSTAFNDIEAFFKAHKLFSIFKSGNPDNLGDYVLFEKDPEVQITESEARYNTGMPLTSGMIASPNHEAIENFLK